MDSLRRKRFRLAFADIADIAILCCPLGAAHRALFFFADLYAVLFRYFYIWFPVRPFAPHTMPSVVPPADFCNLLPLGSAPARSFWLICIPFLFRYFYIRPPLGFFAPQTLPSDVTGVSVYISDSFYTVLLSC